jgi:hypothetical protein
MSMTADIVKKIFSKQALQDKPSSTSYAKWALQNKPS